MGHRYYTEENIRLFRHIKALKDGGVQLKAIKQLLPELEKGDVKLEGLLARAGGIPVSTDAETARKEKMQQFQCIMSRLIAEALEDHTEKMGCEISTQVSGQVIKEMDYLLRMKEEREDERFRRLTRLSATLRRAVGKRRPLPKKKSENGIFSDRKRDRPYRSVPSILLRQVTLR